MSDVFNALMVYLTADMLSVSAVLLLIVVAGITSFMTAALGIGGGLMLLAVMATLVPPAALIPVHGLVQFGSNANRAIMTYKHLDRTLLWQFVVGAILGAALASLVVVQLPVNVIQLTVAGFVLFLVWGPKLTRKEISGIGRALMGGVTTFVSMFVGATGPLVAAFIHRRGYDKLQITATFAACMTLQHLLKMAVFSFVGFSLWQWLPLVIAMVLSGLIGTWLGLKLLNRLSNQYFSWAFRGVITLLALRLIWQALAQ